MLGQSPADRMAAVGAMLLWVLLLWKCGRCCRLSATPKLKWYRQYAFAGKVEFKVTEHLWTLMPFTSTNEKSQWDFLKSACFLKHTGTTWGVRCGSGCRRCAEYVSSTFWSVSSSASTFLHVAGTCVHPCMPTPRCQMLPNDAKWCQNGPMVRDSQVSRNLIVPSCITNHGRLIPGHTFSNAGRPESWAFLFVNSHTRQSNLPLPGHMVSKKICGFLGWAELAWREWSRLAMAACNAAKLHLVILHACKILQSCFYTCLEEHRQ